MFTEIIIGNVSFFMQYYNKSRFLFFHSNILKVKKYPDVL